MPNSALSLAATSAWGTPSTMKEAMGRATGPGPALVAGTRGVVDAARPEAGGRGASGREAGGPEASGPEHTHAGHVPQARQESGGERAVVLDDRRPADRGELAHGGSQRDGADDIRRSRLLALGRFGPDDLVEVDELDGPTAGEVGVPLFEHVGAGRQGRRRRRGRTSCGR